MPDTMEDEEGLGRQLMTGITRNDYHEMISEIGGMTGRLHGARQTYGDSSCCKFLLLPRLPFFAFCCFRFFLSMFEVHFIPSTL